LLRWWETNDDETFKDGVVIERVIHKVSGRSSYHVLIKTNYSNLSERRVVRLLAPDCAGSVKHRSSTIPK
jgi:hypothetical protein